MKGKQKSILLLAIAFIASAVMLTVIAPPVSWAPLAWIALVPFILACSPQAKPKWLVIIAYVVSLGYWLGNLYWVAPITLIGWSSFCFYTAVLWPIAALAMRYCRIKKIPLFLAAAVIFVGAERLQGVFLGGFFWRFLAHSQYRNTALIQIADIFGAAGISFLIAMVNGLIAEIILDARQKQILKISNLVKTFVVIAAVAGTMAYGQWRINQSPEFVSEGPMVASLQSNVPQSVKREALRGEGEIAEKTSREMFDEMMQKSKAAAEAGAELIVWPETMVQGILNDGYLLYIDESEQSRVFDKALSEHSKDTTHLLIGAYGGTVGIEGDYYYLAKEYNSAFLYRPDGSKYPKHYDKIHLVLFGEVMPFRKSCPWLFNILMKFNPLGYDHSLDAGSKYTVFEMAGPVRNSATDKNLAEKQEISNGASEKGGEEQVHKFSVIICYEATMPKIVRRFVIDRKGQKQIDWLVNISNDGWFVRFKEGKVLPSTELAQHNAICVFRAVENRLAIIRSVNTGISCLIDSLGQIRDGYLAASANLPSEAMKRKGIAGWFVDKMPIDKRVAIFSKYGQWLDFCCASGFISLIIVSSLQRFFSKETKIPRGHKKCKTPKPKRKI